MANLIGGAQLLTRIICVGNRVLCAVFVVVLVLSVVLYPQLSAQVAAGHPNLDPVAAINNLRLLALLGFAWGVANDRLLGALLGMIASARIGDPFIDANAGRLRVIGWALLAMQFLDFGVGRIGATLGMERFAASHGGFSVSGWLSVLMMFVLAQIFAEGTAMRDDLEGTV